MTQPDDNDTDPERHANRRGSAVPRVVTTGLVSLIAGTVIIIMGIYTYLVNQGHEAADSAVVSHEKKRIADVHADVYQFATREHLDELRHRLDILQREADDIKRRISILESKRK